MRQVFWRDWRVIGILMALVCASVHAEVGDTPATLCTRAARKVDSFIVDWHAYVVQFSAQSKNQSVLAMFAEHKRGVLKANFRRHCMAKWAQHEDIFTCFAGTTSELGAALCRQADTNRNDWQYSSP